MSRKTVSRGTAAAALATLLTLASAAPSFAAPRHTGERALSPQTGVWSLVLDLSKRLTGWALGVDLSQKSSGSSGNVGIDQSLGADPNGNQIAIDPTSSPIGSAPIYGGGHP